MKQFNLIFLTLILLLSTIHARSQTWVPYEQVSNKTIELTIDNNVGTYITLQNLLTQEISVQLQYCSLKDTVTDTVTLNSLDVLPLSVPETIVSIIAKNLTDGCGCAIELQLDCNVLPIIVSDVSCKRNRLDANKIDISFTAYNIGNDNQNSFIVQYSLDYGNTWKSVVINVPEVTGLSMHYTKTISIN